MKARIEAQELKNLGASQKALDIYNSTDLLVITEENGTYSIHGILERDFDSAQALLKVLDDLADEFYSI